MGRMVIEFGPCLSAETVKTCALIALHMMAEESALRSDRDSSPDLGDMWMYGCPRSLVWSDDGFEKERSEEYCERNVDNLAIEVDWQNWSSGLSFPGKLGGRAGGIMLSLVNGPFCAMRDVCKGSSESLDSPRSLCSECQSSSLVELSQQQSLFLTVDRL